ncbi:MAG TPA: hypothetical protein VHQ02_04635 [Usitatibacter sp.]|jgi:hypothetical protein|nr:hypothetical protein [Usitatibacter sp.]
MKSSRRILFALAVAVALLFGEQVAALHDLGHAVDQIAHKGSLPASPCDQCFACAQLAGAVGTSLPVIPTVPLERGAPIERPSTGIFAAPRLAFLSRGPPLLL